MKIYKGIAGSPGIVSAKMIYFEKKSENKIKLDIDEAVEKTLKKVSRLHKQALEEMGEDKAKIFAAYEMLLQDSMLIDPMKKEVEGGKSTEEAIKSVTNAMADILSKKNNEYMRQRAEDIRYIGKLLLEAESESEFSFPEGEDKYILAAYELTPVDTMMFDKSRLAGFVTECGGKTSHTVILAKSLGIPAVVGVKGIDSGLDSEPAFLDGYSGELVVSPNSEKKAEYEKKLFEEQQLLQSLEAVKKSEARTKDGEKISVCINIGKPSDMKDYESEMLDGVGLFRSEFLYSSASKKPELDEQIEAYREVIKKAAPNAVTIRTLDVGGDKKIDYLNMKHEENPFLGNRGIRLCLGNTDIFREQLEAILIAAAGEKVKIMLPMVTSLREINETKKIISEIKAELDKKNIGYCKNYLLGIMIETPASAISADIFARHCDFFSIGTNDLVQYIMAADRGNSDVEKLYNPSHPSVISMISNVISAGKRAGIETSVCGDLAANTDFTELLLGLGLKKFSVPLPAASRVKYKIGGIDSEKAKKYAQAVLEAEDEVQTEKIMRKGQ